MKIILIAFTLFGSLSLSAQEEETKSVDSTRRIISAPSDSIPADPIVDFPDVVAQFPGGSEALKIYIQENFIYPDVSRAKGDQGRVYINFIVELDGSISGIEIPRSLTPELDAEAMRLVSEMPKWVPAQVDGIPVRSRCRLPITFSLDDSQENSESSPSEPEQKDKKRRSKRKSSQD